MRIAPVPLYFGDEIGPMFESAMAASLMTHRDIRSLSGALAVAHDSPTSRRRRTARPQLAVPGRRPTLSRTRNRSRPPHGDIVIKLDQYGRSLSRAIAHAESVLDAAA